MGGTADERNMSDTANFVYDSEGNLTEDKYLQGESCKNTLVHFYCRTVVYCALRNSKRLKISYDWRGMPIEFTQYPPQENTGVSGDTLYKMALDIDPESVQKMEGRNVQKIIRILEVWKATGEKLSELQKKREGGIGEIPVFWLNRSRENLYARINARVDKMMEAGWLQEIQELAKVVPIDAPAWQSLGYRELLGAGNDSEIDKILEEVKKKTRNYAKRQLTWFRWQVKSTSIDLDIEKNAADLIEKMVR